MKVVLSGATGLVGQALREALTHRGHEVLAHARKKKQPAAKTTWFYGPADRAETWSFAVAEADAVVNLAGAPIATRWTTSAKRNIVASRVDTTQALAKALSLAPRRPRVWINASAIGFYGARPAGACDESTALGQGFLAQTCQQWEQAAASVSQTEHTRLVLLRLGMVLANKGGALPLMVAPIRAFLGGPLGGGKQWISWIHIADAVGMVMWALQQADVVGPLNAVAPNACSHQEMITRAGQALRRPTWLPVPGAPLRWLLGEMAQELLLGGQEVVPKQALSRGYSYQFAHLEAALRDLLGS